MKSFFYPLVIVGVFAAISFAANTPQAKPSVSTKLRCNGDRMVSLRGANGVVIAYLPCGTQVSVSDAQGTSANVQVHLSGAVKIDAIAEMEK